MKCGNCSSLRSSSGARGSDMDRSRRDLLALGLTAAAGSLVGCGRNSATLAPSPTSPPRPAKMKLPPPLPSGWYAKHRELVAERMRRERIDALLLTPSASLLYLTGADLWRSERLIACVLHQDGNWENLGPAFEVDRLRASGLPG